MAALLQLLLHVLQAKTSPAAAAHLLASVKVNAQVDAAKAALPNKLALQGKRQDSCKQQQQQQLDRTVGPGTQVHRKLTPARTDQRMSRHSSKDRTCRGMQSSALPSSKLIPHLDIVLSEVHWPAQV
jgi:hypothetical protein